MSCLALIRRGPGRKASRLLILFAAGSLLAGCTVVKMAAGKRGTDVSRIGAGISRAEVEKALGGPLREWRSASGVLFRLHEYDAGCKPAPGDALAMLLMDVASAGLWEAFMLNLECDHLFNRVVISYDAEGRMLGAFREFDPLPPDGWPRSDRFLEELGSQEKL